jgi:hypothetical protein
MDIRVTLLLAITSALSAGCHRPGAQTTSTALAWPADEHCWWSPFRTVMAPDSVAARYARAYATLGLSETGWSHQADTAWAQAAPTALSRPAGTGVYAARVVAYRRGDTTLVRPFVAVKTDGVVNTGSLTIQFCGDITREAKAMTTTPRNGEPDDSAPVWRRRPLR